MSAKERILVVDDDPNLRKTLADVLSIKGYETVVAANGGEAIAAAQGEVFSLALVDLMLPDIPGLEVMARIKAISPLTEVIILTGHASMETAIEATARGAFSYTLKPYQMDDLLQKIKHAVERKQAQAEIQRLASFPRLHPSPVVEIDTAGNVTYLNPAAERLFPDLSAKCCNHPLLQGSQSSIDALRQGKRQDEITREAEVGEATYELHISNVPDAKLIRIYVTDITQRKRAEQEIELLATTDSLTGMLNRRAFAARLAVELDRAKRYGASLSLAMCDLDLFKHVNDTFGHDVGDNVLQAVAGLLKENIRTSDLVARWGGEEFMLLMPHTEIEAARITAEKLRLAVAAHDFDKVGKLAVSFGVTAYALQDEMDTLLKRVDDALYRAKTQGRNRVEVLSGARV